MADAARSERIQCGVQAPLRRAGNGANQQTPGARAHGTGGGRLTTSDQTFPMLAVSFDLTTSAGLRIICAAVGLCAFFDGRPSFSVRP